MVKKVEQLNPELDVHGSEVSLSIYDEDESDSARGSINPNAPKK